MPRCAPAASSGAAAEITPGSRGRPAPPTLPPPSATSKTDDPARAIDALLPQTQCTQCGYAACRPYAHAVAAGEADINQCPPGGEPVVFALARLTGRAAKPLNPANGEYRAPQV